MLQSVVTTSANPVTKPIGAETPTDALGVTKRMSISNAESKESNVVECPTCGREFGTKHGLKIHHKVAHDESLRNTIKLICEWCGEGYERHPNNAKQSRFCSAECQMSERQEDDEFPGWNRGVCLRSRAIKRDGCTCQSCGVDVDPRKGADAPTAEVHHIIPRAAGGPDAIKNVVTLCPECHKTAHKKLGSIHESHAGLLDELRDVVCGNK